MMKLTLSFILILCTISIANAEKTSPEIIKENCAQKWGTDYRMQEYCQKQQFEAVKKISTLLETFPKDSEQYRIINRCGVKWQWGEGYDFRMVLYCAMKQIEAYNKVK